MPNLKIFVHDTVFRDHQPALIRALDPIRNSILSQLGVPEDALQFAIVGVLGLPDQHPVTVELQILPAPDRTRQKLETLGADIRQCLMQATGVRVAFRCLQHDPSTYIVLR